MADREMERAMELWVSSAPKVTLARFFRQNPGVVDTLEGLSRRLAIPADQLAPEIADHVSLGVLRERSLGTTTVYMLNRRRLREIEDSIIRRARGATP